MRPVDGIQPAAGSSATTRTSIACPVIVTSSCVIGSGLAGGDTQLQLDEVEPGHRLGHRVLHLEPGVDLEERDGLVGADHELDGAGTFVAHVPGKRDRAVAQRCSDIGA